MDIQIEKQGGITYIDAYPHFTTHKEELTAYKFRSIDGHCFGLTEDCRTYYAGEEEDLLKRLRESLLDSDERVLDKQGSHSK